ncbi:MAG: UDP-N-acetylmuramoyl-L-alanine--D-glutamate ligase [Alphaproteobacteria bacterium]|nr:UDP-N-acetylmuramoyl-L-alanine--D-glutamate ligase [Alphaproteobacteria bacterium]
MVVPHHAGRRVIVLGLARGGLAAARALAAGGADVGVWDDAAANRDAARRAGYGLADPATEDWRRVAALVMSPGVPLTHPAPHPAVVAARAAGVTITGDIALLLRAEPEATFCAVTGTNGKSTTTALIGHVLKQAGRRVAVGGNLGIAALDLPPLGAGGVYVLELSSFQLDLVEDPGFAVALLLNIAPDHLDRHGTMEGYVAAKRRIFAGQGAGDTAVVGVDDAAAAAIAHGLRAEGARRVVTISGGDDATAEVRVAAGTLIDAIDGASAPVLDLALAATLPGRHNAQNAAACFAACRALGVARETIAAALPGYPGLPHRQELVAVIDGVAYVNDSKATNADAAARALACYDAVYWIAGGVAKAGGITALAPLFPRVAHAFLIGAAAPAFAATLDGRVPHTMAGDLAHALRMARERATAERRPGAVVLLSPACASFDQFRDFEERGDRFRSLAAALPGRRVLLAPAETAA